jgi:hypothetical protein
MTPYEELRKRDWVKYFEEHFKAGGVRFNKDGKFRVFERLIYDSPWVHSPISIEKDLESSCSLYHEFFANKIGFIHSACHNCYKVVVMPNTVKQLFELCDYQKDINLPGKCGIEKRTYVPRLYGGYFYNQGLEMGRECHNLVKKGIHSLISKDIDVILKRGCTEFEMQYGPSDKWEIVPEQDEYEKKFEEVFVSDAAVPTEMPDYVIANVKCKWLHFAAEAKPPDYTYKEFTGGNPLVTEVNYVTYHDNVSAGFVETESKRLEVVNK